MSPNATGPRQRILLIGLIGLALITPAGVSAKLETWKQESSSAFLKGKREGVVVSDGGKVRLGRSLQPTGKVDAARVWDLARTAQGTVYAATGDGGKVFRREGKNEAPWTIAYDAADTQALSLAVLPDGHVYVGTGPSGQVVDVTDPKHVASRPDKGVQYIWDLAADPKGNLYAATGPTGELWKRAPGGAWSRILDSKHSHLLCVAVAPDGTVYAGSDGEGLVYRVRPDGKTSVVYDATQSEIRTLLFAPDGALYAGTAAESGGGGGTGRSPTLFSGESSPFSARAPGTEGGLIAAQDRPRRPEAPEKAAPLPGRPRPRRGAQPLPGPSRPATTPSTELTRTASSAKCSVAGRWSSPSPGVMSNSWSERVPTDSSTKSAIRDVSQRRSRGSTTARSWRCSPSPMGACSSARVIPGRSSSSRPDTWPVGHLTPTSTTPS